MPPVSGAGSCAELLRRLAAGRDAQAWAGLLEEIGPGIARVAQRILGDESLADDAVQEVLLRIRDHAGKFVPPPPGAGDCDQAARGWILRVATNTCLDLLRQRRRRQARMSPGIDEQQDHRDEGPVRSFEREETTTIVRRQVAELPGLNREAVTLHFFGGLSLDMLARELGVPVDTAKHRVHRGLHALRRRMQRAGLALSLVGLSGLLTEVGSVESRLVLGARHAALLESPRLAGRLALPTAGTIGVTIWAAAAILALVASVAAWWWLNGASHPPTTPTPEVATMPAIASATAVPPSPPGRRLDDNGEWLRDGRMAMVRRSDHVDFSTRVPEGVARESPGQEAPFFGILRHQRIWKLDEGAVSLRLRVAIPPHTVPVAFEFGALLPDGESGYGHWPKVRAIYNGIERIVTIAWSGSPIGSIMVYGEELRDGSMGSRRLGEDMIKLEPGLHRLELVMSRDACWALVDGETIARNDQIGAVPLAQFYFGAFAMNSHAAEAEVRVDEVEIGPSDRLPSTF